MKQVFKTKALILFLSLVYFPGNIYAQNFSSKAKLEPVKAKGFYKLNIGPDIRQLSKKDLSDLRLKDAEGNEIPYLLKEFEPSVPSTEFVAYSIHDQKIEDSTQYLIIGNPDQTKINNILLEIKNTDAERAISVSGSDDAQKWFAVKDEFTFNSIADAEYAQNFRLISFPVSNYSFYKISIYNGKRKPLKISRAGYFEKLQADRQPSYNRLHGISFTQKDSSDKQSYLTINLAKANIIDRLIFHISAPEQYFREGQINSVNQAAYSGNISLSSEETSNFDTRYIFDGNKIKTFTVKIDNRDNAPLVIDSISVYQKPKFIIANLEPGKEYELYFGDSTLHFPDYDIVYFKDKIPDQIPGVAIADPKDAGISITAAKDEKENKDKYLLWIGLGAAGLSLAFMTSRMLKDMRKEKHRN